MTDTGHQKVFAVKKDVVHIFQAVTAEVGGIAAFRQIRIKQGDKAVPVIFIRGAALPGFLFVALVAWRRAVVVGIVFLASGRHRKILRFGPARYAEQLTVGGQGHGGEQVVAIARGIVISA